MKGGSIKSAACLDRFLPPKMVQGGILAHISSLFEGFLVDVSFIFESFSTNV